MRKKLDTRFPAMFCHRLNRVFSNLLQARIKKIMQADEEVGKIAMATPVLISKALELFLQDLCNRTYEITLRRGAKTMNAYHLKQCVCSHSVFDFLQEIVSKVPDLDTEAGCEAGRRRRGSEGDNNEESGEDDVKRTKADFQTRGRGRGRGRGRRGACEKARVSEFSKHDDNETMVSPCRDVAGTKADGHVHDMIVDGSDSVITKSKSIPKGFDLNMEPDENCEVASMEDEALYHAEWVGPGLNPAALPSLPENGNVLHPEEDYDCEDEG